MDAVPEMHLFARGPQPVGVTTLQATDPARACTYHVEVWYPAVVDPDNATDDFKLFLDAGDYDIHVRAEGYISESDGPFTVTESDTEPHPETDAGTFVLGPLVPGN